MYVKFDSEDCVFAATMDNSDPIPGDVVAVFKTQSECLEFINMIEYKRSINPTTH